MMIGRARVLRRLLVSAGAAVLVAPTLLVLPVTHAVPSVAAANTASAVTGSDPIVLTASGPNGIRVAASGAVETATQFQPDTFDVAAVVDGNGVVDGTATPDDLAVGPAPAGPSRASR